MPDEISGIAQLHAKCFSANITLFLSVITDHAGREGANVQHAWKMILMRVSLLTTKDDESVESINLVHQVLMTSRGLLGNDDAW